MQEKASLRDFINYEQKPYISQEDIAWIQTTFRDNDKAVDILRRVFLPSVGDVRLPIEELGKDPWLMLDFAAMQNDEVKPIMLARQDAIKFVMGGLVQLKIIANQPVEDKLEADRKREKDSAK